MRQGVELCESFSALLTVDLKLTKRAGRLSTVDQVRRSVKLCSRSGTPLTGPHLSGGGGGGAFRKHNSLNRPTIPLGKRYLQNCFFSSPNFVASEMFRKLKVSSIGGGGNNIGGGGGESIGGGGK